MPPPVSLPSHPPNNHASDLHNLALLADAQDPSAHVSFAASTVPDFAPLPSLHQPLATYVSNPDGTECLTPRTSYAVTLNAAAEAARAASSSVEINPHPSQPRAHAGPEIDETSVATPSTSRHLAIAPPIHSTPAQPSEVRFNDTHRHRDVGGSSVGASTDGDGGVSRGSTGSAVVDDVQLHGVDPPNASHADATPIAVPPLRGRRRPASDMAPEEATQSNKRPHRSISHAEKRRLCEISDANPSAKHGNIASLFKDETGRRIERSTVTRVLQRKEFWMAAGCRDSNRKRLTSPRFPTIEEALFELIRNRSRLPALRARLTDKELMKHSKEIAETMRKDQGSMDKNSPNYEPHLRSFRGSLSWVTSFKKRNALMPAEESRNVPQRPFVSQSFPGETLDIWKTDLNVAETIQQLSEWPRLEDIYFLDAMVLATAARPEHVATPSNQSLEAQAVDEALGIGPAQGERNSNAQVDVPGTGLPTINFALPSISAAIDGMQGGSTNTNNNNNDQGGFGVHAVDPFAGASSTDDPQQANPLPPVECRHLLEEEGSAIVLLSTNGVGNDRRLPWMVGKKPVKKVGSKDGETWPDCGVRYFHNRQGWLNSRLLRKWVEEFDQSVDRSVVLLTSLFSSSELEMLDLKHVTLMPLPRSELSRAKEEAMSWASASPSPLHHGMEQVFRARYRSQVVERALQFIGQDRPIKPLSMKAAAVMVKEAWEKVPIPVVRRSWRDLPYLSARMQRSGNRQRGQGKPLWGQALSELGRLICTYRDAIPSYSIAEDIDLRQSDIASAVSEPENYIWLHAEQATFHPSGAVLDFVRSVSTEEPAKESDSDDEVSITASEKHYPRVEDHADALDAVNKLAEFMKSHETLGKGHSLYLIGSLQLEIKKVYDHKQNETEARNWISSHGQNTG